MPAYVRVTDKDTGITRSVFESELNHGNYEVLDAPAVDLNGEPLPYEKAAPKPLLSSTPKSGHPAGTDKE